MIDINKTAIENNLAYIVTGIDSNRLVIEGPNFDNHNETSKSELYCNEIDDVIELKSNNGLEETFMAEEGQLKEKYFHIHDSLLKDIIDAVDLIYVKTDNEYVHLKDYMKGR